VKDYPVGSKTLTRNLSKQERTDKEQRVARSVILLEFWPSFLSLIRGIRAIRGRVTSVGCSRGEVKGERQP
jgi:hypothetical protein